MIKGLPASQFVMSTASTILDAQNIKQNIKQNFKHDFKSNFASITPWITSTELPETFDIALQYPFHFASFQAMLYFMNILKCIV